MLFLGFIYGKQPKFSIQGNDSNLEKSRFTKQKPVLLLVGLADLLLQAPPTP